MPIAHHLRFTLDNEAVIASTPEQRRDLARTVLKHGQGDAGLLSFGQADNHLHVIAACDRERAGRLARAISTGLGYCLQLAVGFAPAYIGAVDDQRHLNNAFDYPFRQQARHGLSWDPLFEASNLADLLGLRLLGRYSVARVRQLLPRLTRPRLLQLLGVPELAPAARPDGDLLAATLRAAALPSLWVKSHDAVAARRAMLEVARGHVPLRHLAEQLHISERAAYKLLRQPAQPEFVTAIRLQLDLAARVRVLAEAAFVEPLVARAAR